MTSTPPAALAVVAEGLEFEYPAPRRILALKGVTVRIPEGQFAAIVGQNGSGKTSLARCISGYLRHDYSRRQAFNADSTRFIVTSGDGHWYLYDAATLAPRA